MLSTLDKKIVRLLSQDIPLTDTPFNDLAKKAGVKEGLFITRLKAYKKRGLLRKFSAVVNHRKLGFNANAMCAWNVPEKSVVKAGNLIAGFNEVSHCYQRKKYPDWNYNLYAMAHGKTKAECLSAAKKISRKIGFSACRVLFSSQEYKKASAKY